MKPEPKITATMNTAPATMPTQAAALFSRLDSWMYTVCGDSATAAAGAATAGAGGGVSTGPVSGSEFSGVVVGSLMRRSCDPNRWVCSESAMNPL